ncbi:unnamed protein product, partial [Lymnaea stagnalis]
MKSSLWIAYALNKMNLLNRTLHLEKNNVAFLKKKFFCSGDYSKYNYKTSTNATTVSTITTVPVVSIIYSRHVRLHTSPQKQTANPLKWSYVHGASSVPLLGITVGKQLQKTAETNPNRSAVIFANEKQQLTFTELLAKADMFAAGLRTFGFKHGDRVGIWGPNSLEWVLTQYGTARGGIVLVNINPSYRKNELKYALNKVGCKGLVAAPSYKNIDYISMLRDLMPEMDNTLEGSPLNAKDIPDLKYVFSMGATKYPGTIRVDDLLSMASLSEIR